MEDKTSQLLGQFYNWLIIFDTGWQQLRGEHIETGSQSLAKELVLFWNLFDQTK